MTDGTSKPERQLDKTGHLVICGWSTQGRRAVEDLQATAPELEITIVCQSEDEIPPVVDHDNIRQLCGDPTDEELLEEAKITEADAVVLLADRSYGGNIDTLDSRTILTALTIRELDETVHLIAELANDEHRRLAGNAGIDETIMADQFSGVMLSQSLQSAGLSELFIQLFETAAGAVLEERSVPSQLVGSPYSSAVGRGAELGLGAVAGLRRDGQLMLPPDDDPQLEESDLLLSMRSI